MNIETISNIKLWSKPKCPQNRFDAEIVNKVPPKNQLLSLEVNWGTWKTNRSQNSTPLKSQVKNAKSKNRHSSKFCVSSEVKTLSKQKKPSQSRQKFATAPSKPWNCKWWSEIGKWDLVVVDPEWERSGGSKFGRKTTPEEEVKRKAFFFFFLFPLQAVINRRHVKDGLRRGKVKCAEFFCNTNLIVKSKKLCFHS